MVEIMNKRARLFQAHLGRIPRTIEQSVRLEPNLPPTLEVVLERVSPHGDSHLSGSSQVAPYVEKRIGIQPTLPAKSSVMGKKRLGIVARPSLFSVVGDIEKPSYFL
ncbi:MAG: hypothetical protein EBX99_05185 [Acidimicrobiia bacterium]|nr:hypothetical protein [Acidimicrobiia bacterium]